MKEKMIEVEIWSDFACPFCAIGKRQFEKALANFPEKDQFKVTFKSFELDPSAGKGQKVSIYEVLAKKYGKTIEWAHKANQNVIQMGSDCGLEFNMDKIIPTNSFDAHRLAHFAAEKGFQDQIQEKLFSAYFKEGKDIANLDTLKSIGAEIGLDPKQVAETLNSDAYSDEVREDENEAQEFGIQGVPFFVFDRKFAVSGAQPVEAFKQVLTEALKI